MTQSSSSGKSLTPHELAETRKAVLGLRLSLYASAVGLFATAVPVVSLFLVALHIDVPAFLQLGRRGSLGSNWLIAASGLANAMAAVLLLGAPAQMKVMRVGVLYAFGTVVSTAVGIMELAGISSGFAGWPVTLLVLVHYPAWFLYLHKTARFTNNQKARGLIESVGGMVLVGCVLLAGSFGLAIIVPLREWGKSLARQLDGSTFLHLFGQESIAFRSAEFVVSVAFCLLVLGVGVLCVRCSSGVLRRGFRGASVGWCIASICYVMLSLAVGSKGASFLGSLTPILIPLPPVLGFVFLCFAFFRGILGALRTLQSLSAVCLDSENGSAQPLEGHQRMWFQRSPILAAGTSGGCICGLLLLAKLLPINLPIGEVEKSTELDVLRQEASNANGAPSSPARSIKVGAAVPKLQFSEIVYGPPVSQIVKGKILVIDFWATWCRPCLDSIPHVNRLAEQYADDIVVIGVTDERPLIVEAFLEQQQPNSKQTWGDGISYSISIDKRRRLYRSLFEAAHQTGIPCAFVIGRDGVIEWIGHPSQLDGILPDIVAGTFDRDAYESRSRLLMEGTLELNTQIWKDVVAGNAPDSKHLELFEQAVKKVPQGMFFNTLGVAHYRAGNCDAAIEACLKSVELSPKEMNLPGPYAGDLAFLAMSHFRLGNKDEANKYRHQFSAAMKLDAFKGDEECLWFLEEVNALFASGAEEPPREDDQQ